MRLTVGCEARPVPFETVEIVRPFLVRPFLASAREKDGDCIRTLDRREARLPSVLALSLEKLSVGQRQGRAQAHGGSVHGALVVACWVLRDGVIARQL